MDDGKTKGIMWSDENLLRQQIQRNTALLGTTRYQTEDLCRLAINRDAKALRFVRKQTEDLCLLAVRNFGFALQYVKKQTPQICLTAVKQNPDALQYVWNQIDGVCLAAIDIKPWAVKFVRNMNNKIAEYAVKRDWLTMQYIPPKFQTVELCSIAVKQSPDAIHYIKNTNHDELQEIVMACVDKWSIAITRFDPDEFPQVFQRYQLTKV